MAVVGCDGDGFSIGLGHLSHAIRRNVPIMYAVLDNGIYGLTKGQSSPTTERNLKRSLGLTGTDERPLNPVFLVLSAGCGFVARTHAGNLPHLREMFREALRYPGFAFVHVLAACATYQPLQYAEELFQRCDLLPPDHDAADFGSACAVVLDRRFKLGMIYRRRAGETPTMMAHTEEEPHSED